MASSDILAEAMDVEHDDLDGCTSAASPAPDDKPSRLRRLLDRETAMLMRLERWRRDWLTPFMHALTRIGNTDAWLLHALLIVVLVPQPMGTRWATLGVAAAVAATLIGAVLKRVCRRKRPSVTIDGFEAARRDPDAFSFPSGHTAAAFAVATALHTEGFAIGALEGGLACGIGFSRLYLGAHYPLDVVVGAIIGIACGIMMRSVVLGFGIF